MYPYIRESRRIRARFAVTENHVATAARGRPVAARFEDSVDVGGYRLDPVEWNTGESTGLLAAFCLERRLTPAQVDGDAELTGEFQGLLRAEGVELEWPEVGAA
jgi:hypothetical protein